MNVKRLSKRTLAAFLSVLLLLSTLVVGTAAPASAQTTMTGNGTVTIYFKNTVGWDNVYMYIYDDAYWFEGYGAGSLHSGDYKCNEYSTSGYQMSEIDSTNHIYAVTYSGYYTNYIAFAEQSQESYGNFAVNNKVSYRGDFSTSTPMFIPDTTPNATLNNGTCTYYNNGTWSVADIPNPDAGDLSDVLHGDKVMFYYGSLSGNGIKYLNNGAEDLVANYTQNSVKISTDTVFYSYASLTPAKYYVSESPVSIATGKQMSSNAAGGSMYRYNSAKDTLTTSSFSGRTKDWSVKTNTITEGTSDSGLIYGETVDSVIKTSNTLQYYYTTSYSVSSSSTFEKIDITDVSSLSADGASPKKYYIYPVYYDGNVWVKGDNRATLTVEPAPVPTELTYAQTATAGEGGTATASDGTNKAASIAAEPNVNVTFTAIPNPNYTFDGWYSNSEYTGNPVSTDDPYTISSVNSANTLYAKFSAVEVATEDDDETAPTNETAPSNRNQESRAQDSTSLSQQAVKYYTDEVRNVDKYKTSESGASGVYQTFLNLKALENNKGQDSFDSIYADTTKTGSARYTKLSGDSDKYKYVINNSLFGALYDIMSSTHTHAVSYPAYGRNSLAHYWLTTDSSYENLGDGRGVYTFFYSDAEDYNHKDMQREHIWPKSKASYLMKTGLGGSDLHHLRPAYGKLNLLKLNWGFASIKNGNGKNYTLKEGWSKLKTLDWPATGDKKKVSLWRAEDNNNETFIDVDEDVRGDVARILLYIYTRWREPNLYSDIFDSYGDPDTDKLPVLDDDDNKDTGERIIYDKATLLDWMKNDPVSEWEMKRNDLTQDIQGNRNVFIDYPELAWLIFDENVPDDMNTPSRPQGQSRTEINKLSESYIEYSDPVTLDISKTGSSKGEAEITAYDVTAKKAVKNGDTVERGDIITYTIVPDASTLTYVREYTTVDGGHDKQLYKPDTNTTFTFTKQAGYYDGSIKTGEDAGQEIIKVTLNSNVCVLTYKINSKTTGGGTGGSGSGMVLAQYAAAIEGHTKGEMIESGDVVPNGAQVTLTFTPDYGSRFYGVTDTSALTADTLTSENNYTVTTDKYRFSKIQGTESYKYTTVLDSSSSVRTKKVTVYFAQTFNNQAGSEEAKKHINNKGMRPDDTDAWKDETDFTTNFEVIGVQLKKDEENLTNKALRFVSVIDKNILDKAEEYGYIIGYTDTQGLDSKLINRSAYGLVYNGNFGVKFDCTGTSNDVFGDYGKYATTTNYKYITAAVNNIQDVDGGVNTTIIARPYVVLKDEYVGQTGSNNPKVIYGQYVDFTTGENFCACSSTYQNIVDMKNAENANKED